MTTLSGLFNELQAGFYNVPEIQRSFVWENRRVKELAISIYNNFPIGSIVIWKMPMEFVNEYHAILRPLAEDMPEVNGSYMIIDGQQRLTSLLLIKKGSLTIDKEERRVSIYFNPIEETFELDRGRKYQKDPNWFNLTDIINKDIQDVIKDKMQDSGDSTIDNNRVIFRNINNLGNRFKTYEVAILPANLDYSSNDGLLPLFDKISQIFVKLNSTGMRVRLPDLILALLTGKTRSSLDKSFRDKFKALMKTLSDKDFDDVGEPVIIRLYMAISTGNTRFREAKEALDKMDVSKIYEFLEDTEKATNWAVDMLQKSGIKGSEYLQSRYLVTPIAYLIHNDFIAKNKQLAERDRKEIIKWCILASFSERYTGKLESELGADIQTIRDDRSISGLLNELKYREIQKSDLQGDHEARHLALLSVLLNKVDAKDWEYDASPEPRAFKDLRYSSLQKHHIFPKKFLKDGGYNGTNTQDDFANITLISKEANDLIKDKPPKEYLQYLYDVDNTLLEKHFIPLEKDLWDISQFDTFLNKRRDIIAKEIVSNLEINIS